MASYLKKQDNDYILLQSGDKIILNLGGVSESASISPSLSQSLSPSLSPSISASISPSISPSLSQSISPSLSPSISVSVSPSTSISPSLSPSISRSISPSLSPSISKSISKSLSPSISASISSSQSPSTSISPSISPSLSQSLSPSISQSLSQSLSPSISSSLSPSLSPSISPSVSPSPSVGYKQYTRGDYVSLPIDDTDLETAYSVQDISDVETADNIRVNQSATGQFAIHQFKDYLGNNLKCILNWEGQSDLAPTASTVYLQIYNRYLGQWETVNSDNTSSANVDFTLTASISDLSHYKDNNSVICCRVYQESK